MSAREYSGLMSFTGNKSNKKLLRTMGFDDPDDPNQRITQWRAIEIAQQITLRVHDSFKKVSLNDFMNLNFAKDPENRAPSFHKMKIIHVQLHNWAIDQILREDDIVKRAEVLNQMVALAEKLRDPLCNFDGFVAIASGLNSNAIHRMDQTWAKLTRYNQKLWNNSKKYMEGACRLLAKEMQRMNFDEKPTVPYIGDFLRIFVNMNEFEKKLGDLINFDRIRQNGLSLIKIKAAQETYYNLELDERIMYFIERSLKYDTDKKQYDRSLELQPRE